MASGHLLCLSSRNIDFFFFVLIYIGILHQVGLKWNLLCSLNPVQMKCSTTFPISSDRLGWKADLLGVTVKTCVDAYT